MAKFANLMDNDIASGAIQKQQGVKKFTYTPKNFVAKPKSTPLLTALSTNKTAGVTTNKNTNYKPLAVPTSAQKMANVGIDFKPTAQSQINTINGISNKTITPTPMVQDKVTDTDVERGFYALGNVLAGDNANTVLGGLRYDLARGLGGVIGDGAGLVTQASGLVNQGLSALTSLGGTAPNAVSKWFDEGAKYALDRDVSGAMSAGIENSVEGKKNWSSNITGNLYETVGNIMTGKAAGGAISGFTKLAPEVASKLAMGLSAGGQGATNAYNEGATPQQAISFGNAVAGLEMATESMFGGVPGLGKGVFDDIIKGLKKSPTALKALVDMVGEGGEEVLSSFLTPYLQRILYNPEAKNATVNELLTSFAYGAGLSGLMQAPAVIGSIGSKPNVAQQPAIPSTNVQNTALNGENNVQVVPNNMQNQGQSLTPNLPKPNANKANVSVQENVSVPQQAVQAPVSDIKPQVATDTAKVAETSVVEQAKPEVAKNDIQPLIKSNPIETVPKIPKQKQTITPEIQVAIDKEIDAQAYAKALKRMGYTNYNSQSESAQLKPKSNIAKANGIRYDLYMNQELQFEALVEQYKTQLLKASELKNSVINKYNEKQERKKLTQEVEESWNKEDWEIPQNVLIEREDKPWRIETTIAEHKTAILKALSDGKTVPKNVLSDYPEIQPINNQSSTNQSLFPSNSLGAKITNGMPQGTGAKSAEFGYEEAPTQNRMAENTFTEEEVANTPELENTHKVNPDAYVDRNAQERYDFDYDGEKADLFGKKQSWDDADTKLAIMIIENETAKARESGNPADWINVAKLNKKYAAIGTTWGQEGRQRQRFKNTPTEIIAEAAETLFGEDVRKMSDADKQAVMDTISESADALENTQDGDTGSLIELIKKLNVARRTTGLFSKSTSKKMSSLLEEAAKMDGGFDFLKAVATKQIRNVSADFHKSTGIETVKSIWYQNMLSKLVTFARNVVSNTYTDISETFATDVVVPLDILVSKLTGTRAIPVDLSWVSEAKRKGAKEGFIKSAIQVALDADTRDVNSKYGTNAGRTFKMSGSPIERFFSTWAKWESYGLVSTDEFAKGGTSAETQRGIDKLKGRGLIAQDAMQDRATEVAKQRTFQNEGAAAKVSTGVKSALDYVGVKDKKGNRFGLGTLTNPFPLIPANIASMGAQGTPAGLVMNGIKNLGKMLYAAKNGTLTPEMQAQALTELGRGLVGSAGVAMLTALAIKGVIKTFGDDDKDKEAQQRAEGMNGTQFNIDALIRLANGEDTKWRESDTLVNIGFLETLNAQMATAALIAEDYNSADKKVSLASVVQDSFSGVVQTTLELPALQSIQEIMNGYKYSDSEKAGGKAIDAATSFLGSQVASFVVPNIVRGVATGMDNTVRNAYTGTDTQNAISSILSGIPFARKNLPASLTPFGKESTYTNNPWLNALNANLLPGGITKYKQEAVGAELERLSEATGETGVYPSKSAPSKIGEKELTAAQKDKYKITAGNAYYNAVNELLKDKSYAALNDADKTVLVKNLMGYANDTAKREFVGNTYVSNDYAKVYDAEKAGIAPVSYFVFKSNLSKIDTNGSPTQVESTQAINQTNLSQADKGKLWNIQNSDASPNNNPYTGTLAQAKIPTNTTIAIMEFEATANADKDANGKSISGTKKKKVLDYAKTLGLNSLQINAVCTQYGWTPVTNYTSSSTGKFSMS